MSGNRGSARGSQFGSERGSQAWTRGRGRGSLRGWGRGSPSSSTPSRDPRTIVLAPSPKPRDSETQKTSRTSEDALLTRRRMNLVASVSRSSGLEKGGDDLKNYKIQEEYRKFIQEKLDGVFKDHPRTFSESENNAKKRLDAQENILILFRKLREGVSSSGRNDAFALETYETSLYLSALFESPKQTISIIPHFLPVRHEQLPSLEVPGPSIYSTLISLLHHLVAQYPSQSTYHQQLQSTPKSLLAPSCEAATWLSSLTKSLRTRNYAQFSILSRKSCVLSVIQSSLGQMNPAHTSVSPQTRSDLGQNALLHLVDALRKKAADGTWIVMRAAYRELTIDKTSTGTKTWLERSLCLESLLDYGPNPDAESWLVNKIPLGHVRRKEGIEGRWIVCKAVVFVTFI